MRLIRPVVPPKGKPIATLSDARDYILNLPKAQQNAEHVQSGLLALLHCANGKACAFVAQSAVAHIVHGPPKPLDREKRDRPWMKRKTKRSS